MTDPGEANFGEELRRQRLVREVSLESIAAATKISVRYLEALEKGDFSRLPAPVFTRGFIRAYSSYLGLDPEEMVNAYLSETGVIPLRSIGEPHRPTATRRPSAAAIAIGILVVALGILMLASVWHFARRKPLPARSAPAAAALTPPPNIREVRPVPMPQSPSTAAPRPPEPSPAQRIALSLNFNADCWLELFADERLIFSGMLRSGEVRHFEAEKGFRMTLGNAAAASVTVNGRALPPLGRAGEVLRDYRIDALSPPAP
jgi:cytoskeletal protein RodZ